MCGIVGYLGTKPAAPVLLQGLKRLEYRGYDSAGIALLHRGALYAVKQKGKVGELERKIEEIEKGGATKRVGCAAAESRIGIGHTRWATHGAPSPQNAHPHLFGKFAIVHNGIIENFAALKESCLLRGEKFSSETDSEVIAHLLAQNDCGDLLQTLQKTAALLEGSFAIAVISLNAPDAIAVCRNKSPLIVGRGKEGLYAASDIPALASSADEIFPLSDGEFALLQGETIKFFDKTGEIDKKPLALSLRADLPNLCGFSHYMRKEMSEIPAAIASSLQKIEVDFRFSHFCEVLCQTEYLQIVACGTAYHSGIAAKYAVEALARIPVEVRVASEYRYCDPIVKKNTLAIAVSQSGETADTLAAAQLAKEKGAYLLAVTNAPYSSLTEIADFHLETGAGREIGVAATKSFNAQLAALYFLALSLAKAKGKAADFSALQTLPALSEEVLSDIEKIKQFAPVFAAAKSVYFIGRGADYCAALEGSLKLKEISYLPSEGYPAGELKHGTLALVEKGTPVVAIITQKKFAEKTMNAVCEVYARGGRVLLITSLAEYAARKEVEQSFLIPRCEELFSPILSVIPLQALAYYTALERGNDPDKPRNLAKSVTVE